MTGNRSLKASAASVTGAFCAVVSKPSPILTMSASKSVLPCFSGYFIPPPAGIVLCVRMA